MIELLTESKTEMQEDYLEMIDDLKQGTRELQVSLEKTLNESRNRAMQLENTARGLNKYRRLSMEYRDQSKYFLEE